MGNVAVTFPRSVFKTNQKQLEMEGEVDITHFIILISQINSSYSPITGGRFWIQTNLSLPVKVAVFALQREVGNYGKYSIHRMVRSLDVPIIVSMPLFREYADGRLIRRLKGGSRTRSEQIFCETYDGGEDAVKLGAIASIGIGGAARKAQVAYQFIDCTLKDFQ